MEFLLGQRYVAQSLIALSAILAVLLYALPPEATLGPTIRIVILHGALARAGLVTFAVEGVLGLVLLLRPTSDLARWTVAVQKTSFSLWAAAALTSGVATYVTWGVVIAWGEPRTQGTIKILALALLLLLLTLWIRENRFVGLANLVVAAFAWLVVLGATSVQHPEDPVGGSASISYRIVFLGLVATLLVAGIQFTRWIVKRPVDPSTV